MCCMKLIGWFRYAMRQRSDIAKIGEVCLETSVRFQQYLEACLVIKLNACKCAFTSV
jgi:hypothetical protein